MENVQKVIIPGQGQTSDREISIFRKTSRRSRPGISSGSMKKKLIVFVIFLHMRITYML